LPDPTPAPPTASADGTPAAADAPIPPSDTASVEPAPGPAAAGGPAHADLPDGSRMPSGGATAADGADNPDAGIDVPLPTLEALLLTTHHPLTAARLNELLNAGSARAIHRAVEWLNALYERTGRSFRIEQVAGGYQILTLPEHGDALRRLHQKEADAKLTKAALETLSIVAYKQPILRADVEAIRGVACGEAIRGLMEKHLVKIAGRAEVPGRPILYGTTKRFLELFGLNGLRDLPKPEEFKPPAGAGG
jgi:segregation and condensation protein B